MKTLLTKAVDFLGSFKLAAVLLVMLCVLTLFGTLEQQYSTIDQVQSDYFNSLFVVHHWGGRFPIPWPGGMLLLPALAINLLVGGLLRLRMGKSTLGVFIVHLGIVILLFGSLIEHSFVTRGFLDLREGETDGQFYSYDTYELAILENAGGRQRLYVIPSDKVESASDDHRVRFQHPDLPFDVVLSNYMTNSKVEPAAPDEKRATVVDHYALRELEPISKADKAKNRMNVPGMIVTLERPDTGESLPGILWTAGKPFEVNVGDAAYQLHLRRERWDLPFRVRLDRFVHERHPGTHMDREFSSYVTKIENGVERPVHITMNAPLRSEGYTLYQSSWGQDENQDGRRYSSVFSVAVNPSDRVPLWSCVIIAIGMIIHFGRKLYLHLKAQSQRGARLRREAAAGSASAVPQGAGGRVRS